MFSFIRLIDGTVMIGNVVNESDQTYIIEDAVELGSKDLNSLERQFFFKNIYSPFSTSSEILTEIYKDHIDLHWFCGELLLRNAVSDFEPKWVCWDEEKKGELNEVYRDGKIINEVDLNTIRNLIKDILEVKIICKLVDLYLDIYLSLPGIELRY